MTDEQRHESADPTPRNRVDIFLDGAARPLLSTTPPLNFELDTSRMEDGPHVMRIEAYDVRGVKGVRTVDFTVRNGPGMAARLMRTIPPAESRRKRQPSRPNREASPTARWDCIR